MTFRDAGHDVPEPVIDPRQTRHNSLVVARALELAGAGWYPTGIGRVLADEFDLEKPPSNNTIRCWVVPGYREYHSKLNSKVQRHRKPKLGSRPRALTPELLLAMRVEDGLTYGAISAVARRFFGEEMTEDECRYRLYELGAPKNPNKARPRSVAA